MADKYLEFVNSSWGSKLAKSIGLPSPVPLERHELGKDFVSGTVLVGGNGFVKEVAVKALQNSKAKVLVDTPYTEDLGKLKAVVFDASNIKTSADLKALYTFFHPVIKKMDYCARIVVIGKTHTTCTDPLERAAQRALIGFTKSLAKEMIKGGVANLIYVEEGAQENAASSIRFFVSPKTAFVSGQFVEVKKATVVEDDYNKPLQGKNVLVTGAARGIGKSIAELMARDGATVVVLDIPPAKEELEKVAAAIGGKALALDITSDTAGETIRDFFQDNFGGMDIIVHNAGVTRDKTLGNMKEQLWDMVININLSSEERINKVLLDSDVFNDSGRIICISSISGISGNRGQVNYATSKSGVIGMVEGMASIVAEKGITINAVAPGFIETKMTAAVPLAIRIPARLMSTLQQGGLPVDVAEAIAWLASPSSSGLNGNVVRVCGQSLMGA